MGLKRLDEALASYDKAISLKPGYADTFNNRGNALKASIPNNVSYLKAEREASYKSRIGVSGQRSASRDREILWFMANTIFESRMCVQG